MKNIRLSNLIKKYGIEYLCKLDKEELKNLKGMYYKSYRDILIMSGRYN